MPTAGWCYLQSALTDGAGTIFVAQAGASGSGVTLAPIHANTPAQLWLVTSDGRILSASALPEVLTAPATSGGPVTTAVQQIPNVPAQLWTWTAANQIQNQQSQQSLCPAGDPQNDPVLITGDGTGESYTWQQLPAQPLDAILARPPVPFPTFTGEALDAYDWIEKHLPNPPGEDLRAEYTNVNAPLADWASAVEEMRDQRPPHGVPEVTWIAVTKQLADELTDATTVQALFQNYKSFQGSLTAAQSLALTNLGNDAGMETGTNTTGVALAVVQGTIYTMLSAIPEAGGVIANIVNTAISAGAAAHTVSASPFQVAYDDLWGTLGDTYTAVLNEIGNVATTVLSDWGKLRATAALCVAAGPDSLNWPEKLTGTLLTDIKPRYSLQFMQILLPAKYQIYVYQDDNNDWIDDVPHYAQMIWPVGNGNWNKYWIADATDWDTYPAEAALSTDVWGNGATEPDFFFGNNGWAFPVCWVYDSFGVTGANFVVITLSNQTPNVLAATITVALGSPVGPSQLTISPFRSVQFAASILMDTMTATIAIEDASSHANVATVTVQQPWQRGFEGEWPSASGTASPGYALSAPICNQVAIQGTLRDGYPGAVQVSIFATQT